MKNLSLLLQYIYTNPTTLRKFIEVLSNEEVDEKSVSLPIYPMSKVVINNPQVTVGISGIRHIQRGGGLALWPVLYIKKEHVSKFYY